MEISINNVIDVSVSQAPMGLGEYNTSNLALFSSEAYDAAKFGNRGFKIYLEPTEVAADFGSSSKAYQLANSIFAQTPNILAGGGYFVVIPLLAEVQAIDLDIVPTSGSIVIAGSAPVLYSDSAAQIQTKLRAVAGFEKAVVTGTLASRKVLVSMVGYYADEGPAITVSSNTLVGAGAAPVVPSVTIQDSGESVADGIIRASSLVQFFGAISDRILDPMDSNEAAQSIQPLNKMFALVSQDPSTTVPGGEFDLYRQAGYKKTRCLYYGLGAEIDALKFMAGYMSGGLSTNFDGSNTTSTRHLKEVVGSVADTTVTQTMINDCKESGADLYPSINGLAKIFTSGANGYFDQVYNLLWFVGDIQIAGANYLMTTSTKIPQTEQGMDGLKGAYREVCEQAVANRYAAPGKWTLPDTFGSQEDFLANIAQVGYYIYSTPIAKQSQADRALRKAPLCQIALKEAGAFHSSSVIINVNA